jgi:hypothetical protein
VIAIVDGRPELISEVQASSTLLRAYIAEEVGALLDAEGMSDAMDGFFRAEASQRRARVRKRFGELATVNAR